MNNAYELMVLLKSSVNEEAQKTLSGEVTNTVSPGKVKEINNLGKKALAYPVKKEKEELN